MGSYFSSRKEYRVYHENEKLWMREFWKNGKPNGEFSKFYKNGRLEEQKFYRNGELNGEYKFWYENGRLMEYTLYQNGKREGKRMIWFSNGKLGGYEFYQNGNLEGERKYWHGNGQLKAQEFYQNGNLEGEHKYWYDNGNISELSIWKNNLHLESKFWSIEGNLWKHEIYNDAIKLIEIKIFSTAEILMRHEYHRNEEGIRKFEGKSRSWYDNGTLESILFYRNGKLEGEQRYFYSSESTGEYHRNDVCIDSNFKFSKKQILLKLKRNLLHLVNKKRFLNINFLITDMRTLLLKV